MRKILLTVLFAVAMTGCASARSHKSNVQDDSTDRLTVGKVQREINVGMSSAAVIEALGSPNMVSTDEQRREVWVYDKVSSDVTYSNSNGYASLILIGTDRYSGSQSTQQRTLTIVVKFDDQGLVRDFAYHSSKF